MIKNSMPRLLAASTLLLVGAHAFATENGGTMYPNGNENYMVAAVPPPGFYVLGYVSDYHADTLRDNSGRQVPVNFKVDAHAVAPRLVWVPNLQALGGQVVFHTIIPVVDLKVGVNGTSQSKTGLGDIVLGGGLAYHASDKLHYVVAMDVNAPTGRYNKNDLANIGHNYWNVEPTAMVTYMQPSGVNADVKLMYDYNWKNRDTKYKSGQELHADYALGWGFGNGWVAGVGGYVYRQVTDDSGVGAPPDGNRGKAFAIGPSIKYDNGKGFFVTAKWQKESKVVNRAEGAEFKVKITIPL